MSLHNRGDKTCGIKQFMFTTHLKYWKFAVISWSVKCVLPHSVQADRLASFGFQVYEDGGRVRRCAAIQLGCSMVIAQ